MLDEERGRRSAARPARRPIRRFLLTFAILFTVYALSVGPLYWQWYGAKSGLASPIYLILYGPLERLAKVIPPLGHLLNWYISLWIY